jgi:hypothetical protein
VVKAVYRTNGDRVPMDRMTLPPKPTTGEIADAKRVLERAGYTVVEPGRVGTAYTEFTIDWRHMDSPGLIEHVKASLIRSLGDEIAKAGAATETREPGVTGERLTASVTVILPEPKPC